MKKIVLLILMLTAAVTTFADQTIRDGKGRKIRLSSNLTYNVVADGEIVRDGNGRKIILRDNRTWDYYSEVYISDILEDENGKKIWTPIMASYNQFENCTVAKSLMKWCNSLEADKEKNKRDLEIDLLDGIGGLLTKWIIKGASIKSIHYGSLSYNDYGILTLQVDLNYDDAFIE